ncbi:MAG TPA: Crp/Fnr family transcriptional regulator [Tepidisphaeraceae bacterium]|jgi:CRP/FNR family transcriptional regulator
MSVEGPSPIAESPIGELFLHPTLDAKRLALPAGAVLMDAEQPADNLYYIQQGQVRTYQPGPEAEDRLIDILGPGDWCGASALGHVPHYLASAIVVVPSVIYQVCAQRLLSLLPQHPGAAEELIRTLVHKLHAAHEEAARLVFDDCHVRLLKTLVRFSGTAAATMQADGTGGVVLRITHQQLAQAVGVARETISLALTHLRQQNLLRTGRNQLFFDPEVLRSFAVAGQVRDVPQVA